tara:strand:- start:480 stop:1490 length:1011 start_codon:yes stop_codon:yes gene_type:complete
LKINNKFAIGCLVQWYEIELIGEYLQSVKNALDIIENKENVIVDLYFNMTTSLENIDEKQCTMQEINSRFNDIEKDLIKFGITLNVQRLGGIMLHERKKIYTIADYRREFNSKYCDKVDVLMWGESDSLIPRQTFEILDNLHSGVKDTTPKYVSFFATCKMWDKSWEVLEHPEFTVKPFIDMSTVDTKNWWSLRYNMNIDEMNSFNDKVDDLDIKVLNEYKFNGCGLVISSDVIKSGVNIPRSAFFIHEDTAFQFQLQRFFQGQIPQYLIKNILLVHNRKHTKKRSYVKGEIKSDDVSGGRLRHDWYKKASDMSHHNVYNMFNQSKVYTWDDVFND